MDLNILNKNNNIFDKMKKAALLTAGTMENFNTMTIGWAVNGVIWGKNVFIVYVRPSRYTYKFMEENEFFTISFYDDEYKKALGYLGTKSGRDTDKVKDVEFTPVAMQESVTFKEANLSVLCKLLYKQDMNGSDFPIDVLNKYYKTEEGFDDFHRYYIGEIIEIKE